MVTAVAVAAAVVVAVAGKTVVVEKQQAGLVAEVEEEKIALPVSLLASLGTDHRPR